MKGLAFDPIAEARRQWKLRWGPKAAPSMAAVTSIMRAQQILMGRLNDALRPLGLTFPRYEALMLLYLSRHGSLPLGKIGERLQVHRTSVTNVVDGLEREGFVTRVRPPEDRRTVLATLTPKGRQAAEEATLELNRQAFGTAPLSKEHLDLISRTLRLLRSGAGDFDAPD